MSNLLPSPLGCGAVHDPRTRECGILLAKKCWRLQESETDANIAAVKVKTGISSGWPPTCTPSLFCHINGVYDPLSINTKLLPVKSDGVGGLLGFTFQNDSHVLQAGLDSLISRDVSGGTV